MDMNCQAKIKELRRLTGMNRKEFCTYFGIPYRTVTEWERDNRHAPEYVIRLLEYYIKTKGIHKNANGEVVHDGVQSTDTEEEKPSESAEEMPIAEVTCE